MRRLFSTKSIFALSLVVAAACGPAARNNGGDDDVVVDGPPATGAEICDDGMDNDGDGRADCSDTDCSGVGSCPVCGAVENPEVTPLALPDGVSSGTACSTNAQCGGTTPNCVAKECHASYVSTLNFVGFPDGATLTDPTKLLKVCVNMEHSWLRDLQMELITPGGAVFILHKFVDRAGGEVYLGQANDSDPADAPVPGVGMQYCWTPTATVPILNSGNVTAPTTTFDGSQQMPAGDYASLSPWASLTNTPLNGLWSMRVTDLWGADNGFMFEWSISFDPSLVSDCAGPIIL
ncbi:MAG: hypothetical protein H6Q90_2540 [Deltaproteobacteria bacterium]|nr:hypothetical protein [Deltaproteobacteria bacterium]